MPIKKLLKLFIINLLAACILLEVVLQIIWFAGQHADKYHKTLPGPFAKIYWHLQPQMSWEEYFVLQHNKNNNLVYGTIHQSDPILGWRLIPGAHTIIGNRHFTVNQQGYRALYDYADKPEKFQILILGDSFTFGDDIDDTETWPQLLQQKNTCLNVLNMGGSGYGTDQMLLTLQEELPKYHPDLVITAFIDDDLNRAMLPFRDYKKPLFKLDNQNNLQLTNTPIGDINQVLNEIAQHPVPPSSHIHLLNLYHHFTSPYTLMDAVPEPTATDKLNTVILDTMRTTAQEHQTELMLVYLPNGDELDNPSFKSHGEAFFNQYITARNIRTSNLHQALLMATFEKTNSHYQRNETALVANYIAAELQKTSGWQAKCTH